MGGWGGRREGSGRKRKQERYAPEITSALDIIAKALPQIAEQLVGLARDGGVITKTISEAVGVIEINDEEPLLDENGEPTGKTRKFKRLAFPELAKEDPERLVVIRTEVTELPQDVRAMMETFSRVIGRPLTEEDAEEPDEAQEQYDFEAVPSEVLERAKALHGQIRELLEPYARSRPALAD